MGRELQDAGGEQKARDPNLSVLERWVESCKSSAKRICERPVTLDSSTQHRASTAFRRLAEGKWANATSHWSTSCYSDEEPKNRLETYKQTVTVVESNVYQPSVYTASPMMESPVRRNWRRWQKQTLTTWLVCVRLHHNVVDKDHSEVTDTVDSRLYSGARWYKKDVCKMSVATREQENWMGSDAGGCWSCKLQLD